MEQHILMDYSSFEEINNESYMYQKIFLLSALNGIIHAILMSFYNVYVEAVVDKYLYISFFIPSIIIYFFRYKRYMIVTKIIFGLSFLCVIALKIYILLHMNEEIYFFIHLTLILEQIFTSIISIIM